jgi:hypothetical protein
MTVILATLAKGLISEYIFKRLIYIGLKALVKSTKNVLDDEALMVVAQGLGLEDK